MPSIAEEIVEFSKDALAAVSFWEFWGNRSTNIAIPLTFILNLIRSGACISAPLILSLAVEEVTNESFDGKKVLNFLYIWAGLIGGEKFIQALNGLIISFIQIQLSEDLIGHQYLPKIHHMKIQDIEEHLKKSQSTLIINTAKESSGLLSKVIHEFYPLIFNIIFAAIVLHMDTEWFKRPKLSTGSLLLFWFYSGYNFLASIGYSYAQRHVSLQIEGRAETFTKVFKENMQYISEIKLRGHETSYLENARRLFFEFTSHIFSNDVKPAWYKLIAIKGVYWGVCMGMIKLVTDGNPTKENFDELVLMLNFTNMFHNATESLGLNFLHTQKAITYIKKIKEVMNSYHNEFISLHNNTYGYTPVETPIIEFRRVGLRSDTKLILTDINFSVFPGESCAFVGRSGSGKSSIIELICGVRQPTSGTILINGHDITIIPVNHLRSLIALISQYTNIFHEDVAVHTSILKYNVLFGHLSSNKLSTYQHGGDLTAQEKNLFDDINDRCLLGDIPDDVKSPSGGEKQRIGLAKGLRQKSIIILDEPTSALDAITEDQIIRNVNQNINQVAVAQRGVLLMTGHRLKTIKKADRILVLESGSIVETGTHAELMAIPESVYKLYYEAQRNTPSFCFFKPANAAADVMGIPPPIMEAN
jgi:ABC-type multidrug transport system fused ATPase/permease subunit